LPLAGVAGAAVWLAWLISLAVGGWRADAVGHRLGADHVQYYVVGQLIAEGRAAEVYDHETMQARQAEVGGPGWQGFLPFRYPPFYALCFWPTAWLPYEVSFLLWSVLSVPALAAAGRLLAAGHPGRWLAGAACFYPVFAAVSFGQNSLFSLLFVALAYALRHRGRPFLAGLAAGLLLYKPQLLGGLAVLWLLEGRRGWRSLAGLATMGVVLVGGSGLLMPDGWRAFFASLSRNLTGQDGAALAVNASSQGFFMLFLPGQSQLVHLLGLASSLAALATLVLICWRRRERPELAFACAVLWTFWLTPYVMIYDWSLLLVPAVLLWRYAPEERPRWTALFALVWLVTLAAGPLVRMQLKLAPVAVQLTFPVLLTVLFFAWRTGKPEGTAVRC
jgi:hypothetical protein